MVIAVIAIYPFVTFKKRAIGSPNCEPVCGYRRLCRVISYSIVVGTTDQLTAAIPGSNDSSGCCPLKVQTVCVNALGAPTPRSAPRCRAH